MHGDPNGRAFWSGQGFFVGHHVVPLAGGTLMPLVARAIVPMSGFECCGAPHSVSVRL